MYSSRGSNAYGQQPYTGQSAYGQNLGTGYTGSSAGGTDGTPQVSLSSRHSSMLGGSQDVDVAGYRGHTSTAPLYGGQYSSVYGTAALSGAQQVPAINVKGAGSSALEGRSGYASAISDSPKFASSDYISSSSHNYGHKGDQMYAEKIPDYPTIDRRQYGERQSTYMGRDLQSEPTGRFTDAVGFAHQHQPEMYDRIDQASLLRQEQLLKAQSLQAASLGVGARQADYLAARGTASRHSTQDLLPYGGRLDADLHDLSMLSASSLSGQHAPSILGAAPRRNVDDLMYPQSSSNPGYGVSLPPGRDYATGKGLHATPIESDYSGGTFSRGVHPRIDERKDDRASYLREFELREEERRRELREREKEREREKDRERQRERDRERERERILERREKEKERERKRVIETKRERTPPRVSRDRRGPSSIKEGRSLRRDSPRHEVLHRRRSPVKEKRREYVCKVNSFGLVDVERSYLSVDKRYPKLFVSPEVSKVVVNWPKDDLKLSLQTPVSFEYDFIEEDCLADSKEPSTKLLTKEPASSVHGSTVWNVKIILMSGLSMNALEELSSEKSSDDRIPHLCNILRFAVLKKNHSFTAIGGPWIFSDGGDPSVDDSSLTQTAIRYAKDVTQLDLRNCRNWNRFLEIHYDRFDKDGLFSHKEVTVLFVPDLSECLPSLDTWRVQWLAHKKAVVERERQLSLKKEISREKKDGQKDKEMDSSKGVERGDKSDKKKESPSSGQAVDNNKKEKGVAEKKGNAASQKDIGSDKKVEKTDGSEGGEEVKNVDINKKEKGVTDKKGKAASQRDMGSDKKAEKTDGSERGEEGKSVVKKEAGEAAGAQAAGSAKLGKRKVIRRVIKQKVVDKEAAAENTDSNKNDKLDEKDVVAQKNAKSEISGQTVVKSAEPAEVKTFARKKVTKKALVDNTAQNEGSGSHLDVKAEEMDCSEEKPKGDSDPSVKTIKKKIIKRVVKRKVTGKANDGVADSKVVQTENETENTERKAADAENQVSKIKKTEKKIIPEVKPKTSSAEKKDSMANSSKTEIKEGKEDKKDGKQTKVETEAGKEKVPQKDNNNGKRGKPEDGEKSKDEKAKKDKDGKDESRSISNKEVKEKKKPEEPPRHPGLILQTKWSKDSRLRPSSLSLDSLLDYTDKDLVESSFELSLFAETLYEMLQYQMGCRLLVFLQRLRIKYLTKRNERKRQREAAAHEKENEKQSSVKRLKTDELPVKAKSETTNQVQLEDEKPSIKEANSLDHVDDVKVKEETDEEEDPEEEDPEEEDPEEYEDMDDASSEHNTSNENDEEVGKTDDKNGQPGNESGNREDGVDESTKEKADKEATEAKQKSDTEMSDKKERKEETRKKEDIVDKELLQAFRFFDRNRAGYIRVEDMRLIIHNLGKFLSHRDVKELVQSALLESNTGRDDHILYNKLVRMTDI